MTFGLGEFYSLACALAWAIAVVLFKKSGESLPPFSLNLFKNVLALGMLVLTSLLMSGAIPPFSVQVWFWVLLSGIIGIGIGDTLYLKALNDIGASRMGVAQAMYSPFVIVLSLLFLGEKMTLTQFVGVLLVLTGIFFVTYQRGKRTPETQVLLRGGITAIFSVLLMAIGVVIAKPLLEQYDFYWVVTLRLVGGLMWMSGSMLVRRNVGEIWRSYARVRHWPAIICGSIMGTYISMLLWLAGYKYTDASIAAVLNEMAAVFILLLAVIFLKERLSARQLAGTGLAICGVILVVLR